MGGFAAGMPGFLKRRPLFASYQVFATSSGFSDSGRGYLASSRSRRVMGLKLNEENSAETMGAAGLRMAPFSASDRASNHFWRSSPAGQAAFASSSKRSVSSSTTSNEYSL